MCPNSIRGASVREREGLWSWSMIGSVSFDPPSNQLSANLSIYEYTCCMCLIDRREKNRLRAVDDDGEHRKYEIFMLELVD